MEEILGMEHLNNLINSNNKFTLIGHVSPDGDCIGSLIGFGKFLESRGKEVRYLVPNTPPQFLLFLDEKEEIVKLRDSLAEAMELIEAADVIISLDHNTPQRAELKDELFINCKKPTVLIDHHITPANCYSLIYSYPDMPSNCELLFWIINKLIEIENRGEVLPDISKKALYTGMMTDTNNFSNPITPSTFKMASMLIEMGVNKVEIQQEVYGSFLYERYRLMGYLLYKKLKVYPELGAAVIIFTKEEKSKFNFKEGDTEGLVNTGLNIKGVDISGFFTEYDGYVKVSLRSIGDVSMNDLSRAFFNGGGHFNAAGGRLYMPIEEVEQYFAMKVKEFFNRG